ncbi:acyl-CoA thioesterase [Rhodotorula paludigena]|uniref:acyl-CoA thioesterase n=1 Tax=Rhodotorula paludigena TaxID=86838 RepID=UPI00316C1B43
MRRAAAPLARLCRSQTPLARSSLPHLSLHRHPQVPPPATRTLHMSAQAQDSSATTPPPVGNLLAKASYDEGREGALNWARDNGYSDDGLVELPVQWGEMDANGHVNNAVYFRWLETGRLQWLWGLGERLGPDVAKDLRGAGKGKGPILARINFDYWKPTFYPDNILVAHKVTQLSDKKNVLQAEIYSYAQQAVVGKSDAIVVSYDYDAGKSCAWPTPMLELLVERGAERIGSKPKIKL